MALIKRCCCCSLETGTKIIGYIQVIGGVLLAILVIIQISALVYLRDDILTLAREAAKSNNVTEVEMDETVAKQKIDFAYDILAFIMVLGYVLFSAIMGSLLLAGIYKRKLSFVKWWIRIKTGLILMGAGWLLIQLLILLYGIDSDLKSSIFSLVYDACLILVVDSYYDEESEKPSPEFMGDHYNGVPVPAYC
ncbi:hypothetical protein GE061_012594 [Apolygus lucorum]|uniref:Lysosomal-associated transmembrane protein 4A n=1 Tax=Apolygus lucorum TaxID=248454 RepID=A0A8S9XTY9_APOLU|nr:hypothetical protein GE061_012594 [Apolygus lucorum]